MTNYTILQQNLMNSFETEPAKQEFLWASSRHDADRYLYRAETYAREVDQVLTVIGPMLGAASNLHGLECVPGGLVDFFVKRCRVSRFGAQQ